MDLSPASDLLSAAESEPALAVWLRDHRDAAAAAVLSVLLPPDDGQPLPPPESAIRTIANLRHRLSVDQIQREMERMGYIVYSLTVDLLEDAGLEPDEVFRGQWRPQRPDTNLARIRAEQASRLSECGREAHATYYPRLLRAWAREDAPPRLPPLEGEAREAAEALVERYALAPAFRRVRSIADLTPIRVADLLQDIGYDHGSFGTDSDAFRHLRRFAPLFRAFKLNAKAIHEKGRLSLTPRQR